ncbi:MAG: addiction module protein [Archangium sp.]
MSTEAVYDEVLSLDKPERARLARLLIESLEAERDSSATEAWDDEVSRRALEVDAGNVKTTDWESARAAIHAELERRRGNCASP